MNPRDVKTADDVCCLVEERNVDYATIAMVDYAGQLRGKYISKDKLLSVLAKGYGIPPVSLVLDYTDVILEAPGLSTGDLSFHDGTCCIVPKTCREIPWESSTRNLLFLTEFTGEDAHLDSRYVYKRVAAKADEMGFIPVHACEFEFTLFNETSKSAYEKGYKELSIATYFKTYGLLVRQEVWTEFYSALMDMCRVMDIPVETFHEEMGDGFMEASLAYDEGIAAADQATIFKTFAKALAQRQEMMMTFMARWTNNADGQSGHVHISLRDKAGTGVFYDPLQPDNHNMSETMRHFLGGMQRLMPELLLMLAPNINSYKRFLPDLFSPVAATWGWQNRTCALRVIPGSEKSQRIECRTPGADTNPYLSLACLLGAGLYGVEHKLEPSEPEPGNVYDKLDQIPAQYRFPTSFAQAIDRYRHSEVAKALFGERFVEAFAASRQSQLKEFAGIVTDAELRRFFEFA